MRTKTAAAVALAVALAATAIAANPFGSARTIPLPIQGDPIPGVDVSIEQSPGGIIKGKTDGRGNATFAKVNSGHVVIQCASISTSRSNVKHPPGVIVVSGSGGAHASGPWADTSKPFSLEIVLEGREPQKLLVNITEGKTQ